MDSTRYIHAAAQGFTDYCHDSINSSLKVLRGKNASVTWKALSKGRASGNDLYYPMVHYSILQMTAQVSRSNASGSRTIYINKMGVIMKQNNDYQYMESTDIQWTAQGLNRQHCITKVYIWTVKLAIVHSNMIILNSNTRFKLAVHQTKKMFPSTQQCFLQISVYQFVRSIE